MPPKPAPTVTVVHSAPEPAPPVVTVVDTVPDTAAPVTVITSAPSIYSVASASTVPAAAASSREASLS